MRIWTAHISCEAEDKNWKKIAADALEFSLESNVKRVNISITWKSGASQRATAIINNNGIRIEAVVAEFDFNKSVSIA